MKCQHCENQEATNHFVINWMGMQHHVHLCDECNEKITSHYKKVMAQQYQNTSTAKPRIMGESPFPANAGDKFRQRRKLNTLRGRLNEAIETEQYEVAARLRDEISHMENEVLV